MMRQDPVFSECVVHMSWLAVPSDSSAAEWIALQMCKDEDVGSCLCVGVGGGKSTRQ